VSCLEFDFSIGADHPSLAGHFPGNPVVPGVLLLDQVFQELLRLTGQEFSRLQQVKFASALKPGEQARGCCEVVGARASFSVTTRRDGAVLLVAEGVGTLAARGGL
jgi:3-hydroxymyristoyl/3-hydroxydecanoyl-(acyl carrier protein) dehydratase